MRHFVPLTLLSIAPTLIDLSDCNQVGPFLRGEP
jgi:hypothetical protein